MKKLFLFLAIASAPLIAHAQEQQSYAPLTLQQSEYNGIRKALGAVPYDLVAPVIQFLDQKERMAQMSAQAAKLPKEPPKPPKPTK